MGRQDGTRERRVSINEVSKIMKAKLELDGCIHVHPETVAEVLALRWILKDYPPTGECNSPFVISCDILEEEGII